MKKLIVIAEGYAGVGKNTIFTGVMKKNPEIKKIITYTSRPMRKGEKEGDPYYFLTTEQFKQKIKNNELIEYDKMHGTYRGVGKDFIAKNKRANIFLKDLSYAGMVAIKEYFSNCEVLSVFVTQTKKVLKQRMLSRGEKNKDIKIRLGKSYKKMSKYKPYYEYVLLNDTIERSVEELHTVIDTVYNNKTLLITKELHDIQLAKIDYFVDRIERGKKMKPIKVCVKEGRIHILDGAHRYLACLKTKKLLQKTLVPVPSNLKVITNEREWGMLVNNLKG